MGRLRRKRKVPSPNLTAMGDIAFLLIAFFVVVSDMKKPTRKYEMEAVESPDVAVLEKVPAVTVAVEKEDGGQRRIFVDKEPVTLDGLEAALIQRIGQPQTEKEVAEQRKQRQRLEGEELKNFERAQQARYQERRVILKCDKTTPHRIYDKIMEIIAEIGAPVSLGAKEDLDTKAVLRRKLPEIYKDDNPTGTDGRESE